MAIKIKSGSKIDVVKNGVAYAIPIEDWDCEDPEVNQKSDNAMGNEVCYRFTLEGYTAGAINDIDASIEVWEYPNGVIEFIDTSDNVNKADVNRAFYAEPD